MLGTLALGGRGWPFSYGVLEEREAELLLEGAWRAGIRDFDTAPVYGRGRAERILGGFLARGLTYAEKARVLSKVGVVSSLDSELELKRALRRSSILRSIEASLRRLQCGVLETVFLHRPPALVDECSRAMEVLTLARTEGLVRSIGISNPRSEHVECLVSRFGAVDVQLRANVLSPEKLRIAPAVAHGGGRVLVYGVLAEGLLGDSRQTIESFGARNEGDIRKVYGHLRSASDALRLRGRGARLLGGVASGSLAGRAVAWVLRHKCVEAVIVGPKNASQLASLCSSLDIS